MTIKRSRLNTVIERDRLFINAETSSLIVYDLKKLLDNYFNVEGEVLLEVLAESDSYTINVTAKASGIKTFSVIKN
jgi:hypothetical protein